MNLKPKSFAHYRLALAPLVCSRILQVASVIATKNPGDLIDVEIVLRAIYILECHPMSGLV